MIAIILLFSLSVAGLIVLYNYGDGDVTETVGVIICGLGLFVSILAFIVTVRPAKKYLQSKYTFSIEVKTTILNGVETSRDTIYILTPKK